MAPSVCGGHPIQRLKVILTGASGFVGRSFDRSYRSHYDIVPVSLRTTSLTAIDFDGVDAIVHCAALVHQMQGAPAEEYFRINTDLTTRLAEEAKKRGVRHFIYLSTAHVFGDSGSIEDHQKAWSSAAPCHPSDPYGQSKLKAEANLLKMAEESFKVSVLRPPMVYGPGAKGNIQSLVKLIKKFPAVPLGYRLNRRSLIYIGNLTHFIDVLLRHPKTGVFLPQDDHPVSIHELTATIAEVLRKKLWILPLPHFFVKTLRTFVPHHVNRLFGSLALQKDSYFENYPAPFSMRDGFKAMLKSEASRGN